MRTIGYVRVSTSEQGQSGLGLQAQREAIAAEVERRGWQLDRTFEDRASGKALAGRSGLKKAVDLLDRGSADALIVAKLDRLSRSLMDFAGLMEQSRKRGWSIVALDLGMDTTTPSGEMMASVLATFAQFERRLIGQRTKDALAIKKAQGVRLGRPVELPSDTIALVVSLRDEGMSVNGIARELTARGVPTARGGAQWYPSVVSKVLAYA